MIKFFKRTNVASLQRKYDKLMHEAYVLSKSNPAESMERQKLALEVQKQILVKGRIN